MVELLKSELDRKIGNNYIFKAVQFGYNIYKKGNGAFIVRHFPFPFDLRLFLDVLRHYLYQDDKLYYSRKIKH